MHLARFRVVLALALITVGGFPAACDQSPRRSTSPRDSAGIRLVELAPPERDPGPRLRLEELPVSGRTGASIGAAAGDLDERGFSRISSVDVDPDGAVHVLDGLEGTVSVLDPTTGRVLRRYGRRGDGPGEFRSAAELAVLENGRVFIGERMPLVLHRFQPDGIPLGSARLDLSAPGRPGEIRAGRGAALAEWGAPSRGEVAVRILTLSADPGRAGLNRLVRVDLDGEVLGVLLEWEQPGTLTEPPPVLGPRRSWTTGPGGHVHYSDGVRYEIRTVDRQGRLRRILRRPARPREVSDEDRKRVRLGFREMMTAGGAPTGVVDAVAEKVSVSTVLPAVDGLWSDRKNGSLWVGIPEVDRETGDLAVGEYHVYGPDGEYRGRVIPPAGFRLHSVRDGRIYGSATDALDVPVLRSYRVLPTAPD